jgi:hypothetical protein
LAFAKIRAVHLWNWKWFKKIDYHYICEPLHFKVNLDKLNKKGPLFGRNIWEYGIIRDSWFVDSL